MTYNQKDMIYIVKCYFYVYAYKDNYVFILLLVFIFECLFYFLK